MATAAAPPPAGGGAAAGDSHILREYLVSLGFRIDEQRHRSFSSSLQNLDKRAVQLGASVLGVATAAAVMATSFAKSMERLSFSARYANTTVGALQSLEFAGERAGLAGGTLQSSIEGMAAAFKRNPGLINKLESLGVAVQGRKTDNVFVDMLTLMEKMPDVTRIPLAEEFGMDQKTLSYLLADLPKFRADMEKYNQIIKQTGVDSERMVKITQEYMNLWRELKLHMTGFFTVLMEKALPEMSKLVRELNELLDRWSKLMQDDKTPTVGGVVGHVADAIINGPKPYKLSEEEEKERYPTLKEYIPRPLYNWWRRARDERDARRARHEDPAIRHQQELDDAAGADSPAEANVAKSRVANDPHAYLAALEKRFGLQEGVLDAMWYAESGRGKNKGPSSKGALGDFQFMPGTAKDWGVTDRSDFAESARGAAAYMAHLQKHFGGDLHTALAAWNWGPENVMRKGLGAMPDETRGFVNKVEGQITMNTEIHVHGVTDPERAAAAVSERQKGVAGEVARQLRPKMQ